MRLLRLVAAVVVLGSGAGTLVADPQWDAAAALEQTLAADEWIRRAGSVGVAAPAAWSITERAGLAAPMTKFAEGNPGGSFHLVKSVSATRVIVDGDERDAVVKAFKTDWRGRAQSAETLRWEALLSESDSLRREALYLEYLRGQPGIPTLYGAYFAEGGSLHLVVERCGNGTIGGDRLRKRTERQRLDRGYEEMAAAHPLGVARAWIRLFRSFAERGGFLLVGFKPSQFAYGTRPDGSPALWLIDGPEPNAGPLADAFARREGWTTRRQCCCESERCELAAKAHARSAPAVIRGTSAPESRGVCGAASGTTTNCAPITDKTHAYDLGARAWLLPRLVTWAKSRLSLDDSRAATLLEEVVRRCTRVEPRDRPAFDDLLALLDVGAEPA